MYQTKNKLASQEMTWDTFKERWMRKPSICTDIRLPTALRRILSMIGLPAFTRTNHKTLEGHLISTHTPLMTVKTLFKTMMMAVLLDLNADILIQHMNAFITLSSTKLIHAM